MKPLTNRDHATAEEHLALNDLCAPSRCRLARNSSRLQTVLEVSKSVARSPELRELLRQVSCACQRVLPHDYASLTLYDDASDRLSLHALSFPSGDGTLYEGMDLPRDAAPAWDVLTSGIPRLISGATAAPLGLLGAVGLRSGCLAPLFVGARPVGTLNLASYRADAFTHGDAEFLEELAVQVAVAVEKSRQITEIAELKHRLAQEDLILDDEFGSELRVDEIVGQGLALKRVLRQAQMVADCDATVLILGETGTGKELLARAIHTLSRRRQHPFVKVNAAAIPGGLLESELFGHEKGAFTGAAGRKTGRLELAHQGTFFLDEIGDVALELQPKLLHVLQEREFERLGGTRTIRPDLRFIVATNRNLTQMVAEHQFRADLFYRISVFPIHMPPLRERAEDIPLLVRHFTRKYARRMNKRIETVSTDSLRALMAAPWPGNVRELEHVVERAVILTRGRTMRIPPSMLNETAVAAPHLTTNMVAIEREHIARVLRETHGVVGGPVGAAARLGLKRTTLISRMQKLRIAHSVRSPGHRS